MKPCRSKAYTLVEMMVTLVIMGAILSVALITLRGYIPKQRLLGSIGELENFLQRAQAEASARSYWTCVTFNPGTNPITAELFADVGSKHGTANACTEGAGALRISTTQLKRDIIFAPTANSGCANNVDPSNCVIWFDSTGLPKKCPNSGACGGTAPTACIDASYQIVLSNPNLESGTRARELEVISGGLIQSVTLGNAGLASPAFYAKGRGLDDGCE